MQKKIMAIGMAMLLLVSFAGCSIIEKTENSEKSPFVDEKTVSEAKYSQQEAAALKNAEAAAPVQSVSAPGTDTEKNDMAVIDYSNIKDGYVMIKYNEATDKTLMVQVKGPTTTYTYYLTAGNYQSYPMTDGNGAYQISVYIQAQGDKYATVISKELNVEMTDETAPFLHSNQYVDYDNAPNTVALAKELTKDRTEALEKVKAVYEYVVESLSYDYELAKTVQSGYLPVLDNVLESKKGICFDYAALMAGMLRSQGVPSKLVMGYTGETYHAWLSIWAGNDVGWVDNAVYFDGSSWKRLDPTYASTGGNTEEVQKYIGTDTNYSAKYFY